MASLSHTYFGMTVRRKVGIAKDGEKSPLLLPKRANSIEEGW